MSKTLQQWREEAKVWSKEKYELKEKIKKLDQELVSKHDFIKKREKRNELLREQYKYEIETMLEDLSETLDQIYSIERMKNFLFFIIFISVICNIIQLIF